jgi:hypothetical protein
MGFIANYKEKRAAKRAKAIYELELYEWGAVVQSFTNSSFPPTLSTTNTLPLGISSHPS